MPFALSAMPRASLVARGCSCISHISHRDAYRIAALFSSSTDVASHEASGAHPSHIAHRIDASAKKE